MSVSINPAIAALDKSSLCYNIYIQLYNSFFNSHDKKDETHPWGITEGDEVSIRLHNTAYNFAEAIAGGVTGSGDENSDGGVLIDYLKKSGGDMSGGLRANYGFQAGIDNTQVVEVFKREQEKEEGNITESYGMKITGNLEIGGKNLFLDGHNAISYDKQTTTVSIISPRVRFENSLIHFSGELIIGKDKTDGIYISPTSLLINGNAVYHSGNVNKASVDWTMKNALVENNLLVKGTTGLAGRLSALHGLELGMDNDTLLSINNRGVIHADAFLSFSKSFGIQIDESPVLIRTSANDIMLGAAGGSLLFGSEQTNKIKLFTDLFDIDGDYRLISKYGAAYFPDSLTVRHKYGDVLLSSYRRDDTDEGMIIHKKVRFGTETGAFLYSKDRGLAFSSSVSRLTEDGREVFSSYESAWGYKPSSSRYQPLDRVSDSFFISTDADFFTFNKAIESKEYIGIDRSFTRLRDGCLFFNDEQYLLSASDGIKHYGNAFFLGDVASERFSSGFAGSGWAILRNKTTGNLSATFDELTIRKKMRIYEMEIQKISAANGSLWISDHCSGDRVEKIN